MELTFHYLIMAEQSMFQKELLCKLKKYGLTIGQPKILDFLYLRDGIEQKEIARGCHIEPGTLTTILNGMEKNGLIERRMQNGNRRSLFVFLTEKGKEQAQAVRKAFHEIEETAFRGLEEEERNAFLQTFQKIYQNTLS